MSRKKPNKRKTVTRTKTYDYDYPLSKFYTSGRTKSVVVKGKDGTVKRTKDVQKSYSNKYGDGDLNLAAKGRTPALVKKTRKKKDGTTVTKTISRRGTKNNLKYESGYGVSGSVDKSKRKVTKQRQRNVTDRGTMTPFGTASSKRRKVTKTKATSSKKATKEVVITGKDGTVKRSKNVYKSPSKSYGPTLVTKSKKNKDGTITTKDIERSGIKRKVTSTKRDFPLPPTTDETFT